MMSAGYILLDIFLKYFTGSYAVTGLFIALFFGFIILVLTRDIRISIVTSLPVLGFFVMAGWFGTLVSSEWIVNLILIVMAIFYGYAVSKLL